LHTVKNQLEISWQEWARRAEDDYGMLRVWRNAEAVPSTGELKRLADAAGVSLRELEPEARHLAEMKTPIARLLEELGVRFKRASNKAIPGCIFKLPREQLAIFLKVLFTCDGSVYINTHGQP